MNNRFALCGMALMVASMVFGGKQGAADQHLTILHTNDTHSIIDPYYENDLGGVARRKVLIDSVRAADKNVMLIDAGDVLQGSLYFTLFGGKVEQQVMNALDYDIQILGNHEFDNGVDSLRTYLKGLKAEKLCTNYDLQSTPIADQFEAYTTREIGGKKIGFIAINVDPHGLIDSVKALGVEFFDGVKAANAMAWYLRHVEHCDYVVAVTHIGYEEGGALSDVKLAKETEGIDLIIGGHSHTLIDPSSPTGKQSRFVNAVGDTVIVAQTGKYGANLGKIDIDLTTGHITSSVIPVDSRLDSRLDPDFVKSLAAYRQPVDSIFNLKLTTTPETMNKKPQMMNWMADFVYDEARRLTKHKIDLSFVNSGGIRSSFTKGNVTKGQIMQAFPFDNYIVVEEIDGRNLIATIDSISNHGGNGVSRNVDVQMSTDHTGAVKALIDGKPIDPNRTYYVATINYLASGNDGMEPLKYGKIVARSENYLYDDMINAYEKGRLKKKKIVIDNTVRMHY
ncbi:MAG: bifunctional metallophosphatase/5'-nucleotidase [Bacteroides sp.]|nr:bifunctional metallophosphatase/5'-nucleotidase [Bacteroides sp.]